MPIGSLLSINCGIRVLTAQYVQLSCKLAPHSTDIETCAVQWLRKQKCSGEVCCVQAVANRCFCLLMPSVLSPLRQLEIDSSEHISGCRYARQAARQMSEACNTEANDPAMQDRRCVSLCIIVIITIVCCGYRRSALWSRFHKIWHNVTQANVASPEMTSSLLQSYPALGLLLHTVPMQGSQQCSDHLPLAPCPLPGTVGSVVCPGNSIRRSR